MALPRDTKDVILDLALHTMTTRTYKAPASMSALLAAPKGATEHYDGEAFLLHVFWRAPDLDAARRLLAALAACARATHRDTPCVPTYFFRLSPMFPPTPVALTAGEHPWLSGAVKKLQVGVHRAAVEADLRKYGLDMDHLDLSPHAPLPESLQRSPVWVEFTEVYLDERAFIEHAGSRDYLDAYGRIMDPACMLGAPTTMRLGDPVESVVAILEPILKERVAPMDPRLSLWRAPTSTERPAFVSLDFATCDPAQVAVPPLWAALCTTCVVFQHPVCDGRTRLLSVLAHAPDLAALQSVAALAPVAGQVHVDGPPEDMVALLEAAGLSSIIEVNGEAVGHVLHERAPELRAVASYSE
ncbi:hypothetical protein SPRG_14090 [Saprolegnia parasitica CBS 223.65]|uniref:Uncharacterized protein n=1 Tax=Saprolegnia parasitica (strain CBS 223.65) TaxID=695850 RepID=A0A067BQT0_SAPPC|nr:hypothetical protein SPRG_14090 [Saprolegnia parasitica CBS 223.65]KDO20859.1 hypothetical protein SPRG_14090 [Saprolegnia parasitica CBS 223.65]|eukprot:XP_012208437.1 hypothetical protein SPRG_14090 [Saprolegnia parasitica CBS 223.65]